MSGSTTSSNHDTGASSCNLLNNDEPVDALVLVGTLEGPQRKDIFRLSMKRILEGGSR